MKTHYFDQETADLDDALLADAIAQKRVPKTCLWGGVLVQEIARANLDPCTRCPCPKRDACGGRPMVEEYELDELAKSVKHLHNNESGARKLMRRTYIRDLLRAGQEEEKRRKK